MKVFSIYDSAVQAYLQPFFMKSKGEVLRALSALVNDPEHNFCKYAGDFTVFELGSFDETSCVFTLYDAKQSMCSLNELKSGLVAPVSGSDFKLPSRE